MRAAPGGMLRARVDRARAEVAAALGPAEEAACAQQGQAMTVEEALRFALSNLE